MTEADKTPAAKVMMEAIDLSIEGRSPYPDQAYFLNSDAPSLADHIKRAFDDGYSVVLVFPDGDTTILHTDPAVAQQWSLDDFRRRIGLIASTASS